MGLGASNPISDSDRQRIQEAVEGFVESFGKTYPLEYKTALIEQIKEEVNAEENPYQLLDIPPPSDVLKEGLLEKRGAWNKSFKTRYFVAKNTVDNYIVEYYSGEGGSLKGTISTDGYWPRDLDENEAQFGPHGFKLVPWDDRRRVWYFRASTAEEAREWRSTFYNSCRLSRPPQDPDPIVHKAFVGAYEALRSKYGYWGWYSISMTEPETLGALLGDIINRDITIDIKNQIPDSPLKSASIKLVDQFVYTTIMAAVSTAWRSAVAAANALKDSLSAAIKEKLTPIFEAERTLKDRAVEILGDRINPPIQSAGSSVVQPLARILLQPLSDIYVGALSGFHSSLSEVVGAVSSEPGALERECKRVDREFENSNYGPLRPLYDGLDRLNGPLGDLAQSALQYTKISNVLDTISDSVHLHLHKGVYTFRKTYEEKGRTGHDALREVLQETTLKLAHDYAVAQQEMLSNLLQSIVDAHVTSQISSVAEEATTPLTDLIPEILQDIINPTSSVDDVISDTIGNAVQLIVGSGLENNVRQLNSRANELR